MLVSEGAREHYATHVAISHSMTRYETNILCSSDIGYVEYRHSFSLDIDLSSLESRVLIS